MNTIRTIWLAGVGLIMMACAGCSAPMPAATAAVQSDTYTYVVMGLQPHEMRLQIDEAVIENNHIKRFTNPFSPHYYGQSSEDFIVFKVKSGTTLAIRSASVMFAYGAMGMHSYPCGKTMAFDTPPGKVIYLSDLTYSNPGSLSLETSYENNFTKAKAFMEAEYPSLAKKMEQGRFYLAYYKSLHRH